MANFALLRYKGSYEYILDRKIYKRYFNVKRTLEQCENMNMLSWHVKVVKTISSKVFLLTD